MIIKTVIADDEPLARERIKHLLSADPDFQLVRECRNGKEVLETLLSREVDLLLLDIHMPGTGGFEAIKAMGARKLPMIVFVTAYDRYAIEAFAVHALDYLLKPIEAARFHEAVKLVKQRKEMEAALVTQEKFTSALTALESLTTAARPVRLARFVVRSGTKDIFVPVNDIVWIEAADYYVCLHAGGKKHLLRESIKNLETQLDPRKFIRVHRSAIVNIDFVREIHRERRSEGWVTIANGDQVRMSTAGWQKLLSAGSGVSDK
jgi:two-component system LytT family response regulator